MKNTPNISLNHLITPCKPPACSNRTTHHKTNHKHHNYNAYKYWHQVKYYSSHLIKHSHSHLQEIKNTLNFSLNHLITPCKPPACSNTTTHHKSNFQHHKYRVLQVFKSNKILFIISNKKYSFTFARNKNAPNMYLNHFITPCKPPTCSNTTTHHKTNFQHHKYRVLQVFKSNKILCITYNQQYSFTFARIEKHS